MEGRKKKEGHAGFEVQSEMAQVILQRKWSFKALMLNISVIDRTSDLCRSCRWEQIMRAEGLDAFVWTPKPLTQPHKAKKTNCK